jgi:hypothetical protein
MNSKPEYRLELILSSYRSAVYVDHVYMTPVITIDNNLLHIIVLTLNVLLTIYFSNYSVITECKST